ncbi:sigma-54-dependent transcriptional regulator [Vulgatibacter sp.]|uniref:sigma-54-dependent transcriptional regulator n=1 Tax=Vulgatibacter sp. TaxID=1971226 RepID=UPI0035674877
MATVLIIDDNEAMREGMAITVARMGHDVTAAAGGAEGLAVARRKRFDFVVTDLKMDGTDGLEVVRQLRAEDPDAVVLVVTAFGTVETAVEAMKQGAFDFIQKPFPPDVLRAKVDKALEVAASRREVARLREHNRAMAEDATPRFDLQAMVGQSQAMQTIFSAVRKVAATDTTVLVLGESGTGKELIARALHDLSPRRDGPFVTVNCAALAEGVLESELFGHEKGAFTGAIRRKLGRFELADDGTIFLDEIGEISMNVQTKLLRVLQEREIQRVGGDDTVRVDVRVISATNKDLAQLVKEGRFREDLYYRLHIVPITLPPLRERPEDIPLLAEHFVRKHAPRINRRVKAIGVEARKAMVRYRWPGNVRELENAVEQALVFCEAEEIGVTDLPQVLGTPRNDAVLSLPTGELSLTEVLEDLERQLIARAYEKARGVKTETARLLGIKTSALYYKLEKYGFIQKGEQPDA